MLAMTDDAEDHLRRIGASAAAEIDLAEAGLALASLADPQAALKPYRRHLASLAREVGDEAAARVAAGTDASTALAARVAALTVVLVDRHGYAGDTQSYDDLQNANLMRVIDRRRGLPVALGILYIHAARAQGWGMVGLNFPGHFLVRLQHAGARAILDPFNGGRVREPAELRELVKTAAGERLELLPEHYAEVGDRDVLVRLQNNIKTRLIQAGELVRAAAVLDQMLLFAPQHVTLHAEIGVLQAKLGNLRAAVSALEAFLAAGASETERRQAADLIQALRGQIN